jgi:putative ABC transport system permease protein
MNIVNKLTVRQLKLNRKRTLITIIGTIISAAMITAVAILGLCFIDLIQREAIASKGEWHVVYQNVNQQQLEAIERDSETKTAILSRDLGYAYLVGSENNNKPYLYLREYSREGYDNFPIKLKEGRLPESPDEIVMSEAVFTNAKVKYKVGDIITLPIGQRIPTMKEEGMENLDTLPQEYSLRWQEDKVAEYLTEEMTKTYTVVGIIERPAFEYTWSPGYTTLSYIDESTVTPEETFDVSVIVKHINNKLFEHADRLAADNGIEHYGFNNELLRYYGVVKDDGVRNMLFTLSAIIMVIIMIGSISLIYNAFAISVSERSRYLGMLSSVGATKKQKRNSVFFEGAVIGSVSIPIGIAAGHAGLAITFLCINPLLQNTLNVTRGLRISFYPTAILVAILISGVTILISTYIPARRASNVSAIDAIRQTSDVRISKRQIRTWGITRRIFGIEGELGLKNLKRNRGRYKATVFSLIISMILFLVVSSFTESLKKSLSLAQDGVTFDIQSTINGDNKAEEDKIIGQITSLEDVKAVTLIDSLNVSTFIPENQIADYLVEYKDTMLEDGRYPYMVTINALDPQSLKDYAKEVGADYGKLTDPEHPGVIVIDEIKYKDWDTDKYAESRAVKLSTGEDLSLSYRMPVAGETNEEGELLNLEPVSVISLTNKLPMGILPHGKFANFHIILSREVFDRITEGIDISEGTERQAYFTSNQPLRLQQSLEAIQASVGNSKLSVYNLYAYRQSEEQMVLLLSVFTYAFIILITAICAANILNTVSTSIALRKREFAMLKSVGITPKGFNKMLNYESIFYGVKSLLYGLPISFAVMYLIHKSLMAKFDFAFTLPVTSLIIVVISVFLLVGTAMLYAGRKVKRENIIDALKQEII